MYFKLRALGLGPREMMVGMRKLISLEAAALDKPVGSYTWQMDANGIEALRPAPAEPSPRPKGSRAQDLIRLIVAEKWPDGCEGVETGQIIQIVSPVLEKRSTRVPGRDTFLRALGRRKG
jgi:hypothetical protein